MTWTYNVANLSSVDPHKDQVRFLIGDTVTTDQQLQDEEISFLLTDSGDLYSTAIAAAQALVAHYAREVDKSVGQLSIRASQRAAQYKTLITTLKDQQASNLGSGPWAASLSVASKKTQAQNTDIPQPAFVRGMRNDPAAGENSSVWDERTL